MPPPQPHHLRPVRPPSGQRPPAPPEAPKPPPLSGPKNLREALAQVTIAQATGSPLKEALKSATPSQKAPPQKDVFPEQTLRDMLKVDDLPDNAQ